MPQVGFVPPPYPHDRLDAFRRLAAVVPGGVVDCSVGSPVDPVPEVVLAALQAAAAGSAGYPLTIGSEALRHAASGWIGRRFGVDVAADAVLACVGTKEMVASLPRWLHLRTPGRDTVLYPAISYPTYAMGAELAGLRAVPVPLDADWHLDLARVAETDAQRALLLWTNEPGNPTAAVASPEQVGETVAWAAGAGHHRRRRRVLRRVLGRGPDDRPRPGRRRRPRGALPVEALQHGGLPGRVRRR